MSCMHCEHIVMCLFCVLLGCFLLWVAPGDEYVYEDPVESVPEEECVDLTEEPTGKMIITLDTITIFTC